MVVAIIGGSISGIYSGIKLAENGVRTYIFEKRGNIEGEERILIVTPEIFKFIDIPKEIILNKIERFEIFSKNERAIFEVEKPDIVIEKNDFIKFLQNLAISKGVNFKMEYEFKSIFKEKNKFFAHFQKKGKDKKECFDFNEIIIANGAKSEILKSFYSKTKYIYLIQKKILLPQNYDFKKVTIWFDKRFTDYFIWLIPYSKNEGVCGSCSKDEGIYKKLDEFIKEKGFEIIGEPQCGIVPSYSPDFFPQFNLNGLKIFLVGDAGLQIKLTTVGGTFTGIWGGFCAVESIIKRKDFNEIYKFLKRELNLHFYIRKVLSSMDEKEYDKLLLRCQRHLKSIFYKFSRDKLREFFISLFLKEPYLIFLGIKKFNKFFFNF
jgi:flavin-dependent dehydrogenase